jgi:hypothetical protein
VSVRNLNFRGFYIGAIASALLLAFGIELLVATIQEPLAVAVTGLVNWVIRIGRFGAAPIPPEYSSWIMIAYTGVTAVAVLLAGLKLAAWTTKGARPSHQPSKPTPRS